MTAHEEPTLVDEAPETEPAGPTGDAQPAAGRTIGRYVILERIGAGGMGVVYAAYDPKLDRKVALKLLAAGASYGDPESDARQQRLLHEARALAQLNDPHVVAVHDVGTHGDRVFVAMEFIVGVTLRTWLRDQSPDWREIVHRFVAAGEGLAAAHRAELVHRDFKPDNVMVGDDGHVKVLDFGLVFGVPHQASGAEREAGHRPHGAPSTGGGTPHYMSPEQIERRPLDPRTDQFSLCVALFEALFGRRPFAGETLAQLLDNIVRGRITEAPRGRVPPAIHAAVVRGLRPNPDDRFATIDALLDTLRARASPRRGGWLFGGALGVGAIAAVVATRPHDDRCDRADAAADVVLSDRARADVAEALAALPTTFSDASADRVVASLEGYAARWRAERRHACRQRGAARGQDAVLADERVSCLEEHLDALAATVAVLQDADATVGSNVLQVTASLPPIASCRAPQLRQRGEPPDDLQTAQRVREVRAMIQRAERWRHAGRTDVATAHIDAATAAAERIGYAPLPPEARLEAGRILETQGRYAAAEQVLREVYFAARRAGNLHVTMDAAIQMVVVAGSHRADRKAGMLWADIAATELALRNDPALPRAEYLDHLAQLLHTHGDLAAAERAHRESVTLRREVLGDDDVLVAKSLHNLGTVLVEAGKYEEAAAVLDESLAGMRESLGDGHPILTRSYTALGQTLGQLGQHDRAEEQYLRAIAHQEATLPPTDRSEAPWLNLGTLHHRLNRTAEARRAYEQALAIAQQRDADAPGTSAIVWLDLANLDVEEGNYGHAEVAYAHALDGLLATLDPSHPHVAIVRLGMGETLLRTDRPRQAIALLEQAESILAHADFDPHALGRTRYVLGKALCETGGDCERGVALARLASEAFADNEDARAEIDAFLAARRQGPG